MSNICFREALAYLGLQLRATFQKEIDKQEAEIKKKKLKEKLRKLSWSVAAVTRKRGAENYFIWGLSGEEFSKLTISSQSKAQCWFRKRKTELKIILKDQNLYSRNAEAVQRVFFLPTVILQNFGVVLFSVISVVNGFTEIKKTPKM